MHAPSFIIGFAACFFLLLILRILAVFGPWAKAFTSNAPVPLMIIIGMRLRGTNTRLLIDAYTRLIKRNKKPSIAHLETVYIANRNRIHTTEDLIDIATLDAE